MMATTTSSSISVNPDRARAAHLPFKADLIRIAPVQI
jgi:hypothetical protein